MKYLKDEAVSVESHATPKDDLWLGFDAGALEPRRRLFEEFVAERTLVGGQRRPKHLAVQVQIDVGQLVQQATRLPAVVCRVLHCSPRTHKIH